MKPGEVGPSLGRVRRFLGTLQATLLILALCVASAAAQSIVVRVGDETTVSVAPGAEIEIPVVVDMAQAGGMDIASLTFELSWDPDLLSYVGATPGTFGSVVFNEADVASGQLATSLFNATGTTNTFTAINVVLSADAAAEDEEVCVAVDVTAAGDGAGTDILASVSEANLCLCIAFGGLLGDASNDRTVNIIDAQQIARYSVGLPPPPDPAIVEARCDVNGDGQHNIIDAQQIARWTVGLPVPESPGIGQAMPVDCPGACCGDITGTWQGTIEGSMVFPVTLWLTEAPDGTVTGTGVVQTDAMSVTGSRAGSDVTLTMTVQNFTPFVFTGVWDGADNMTGVTNESGFVDAPTTLTRIDDGGITESEPNDGPATADAVSLGDRATGALDPAGDTDYWTFWAEAGTLVNIDVDARATGSPLDPVIELFDDEETSLAVNDDYDGLDSRIVFLIPTTGDYFLAIRGFAGQGGPDYVYAINFNFTPYLPPGLGITGTWEGTIEVVGSGFVPARAWLTEANGGTVTGSAFLEPLDLTVDGARTASDVTLTLSAPGFEPAVFTGTWDDADALDGVVNGSGFTDAPTHLTRIRTPGLTRGAVPFVGRTVTDISTSFGEVRSILERLAGGKRSSGKR